MISSITDDITVLSTEEFLWMPMRRLLSAEASELGFPPGVEPPSTIYVTSHHTGKTIKFYMTDRIFSSFEENTINIWTYKSRMTNVTVEIFND